MKMENMLQPRAFRMTSQRRTILEELRNCRWHPTADEVYERVRRKLPRISLGTVYRNLEVLALQGTIRKLDISGRQKRFDADPRMHCHVRCLECGAMDDLPLGDSTLSRAIGEIDASYEIREVRLEFLGLCPKCKAPERACRDRDTRRGHSGGVGRPDT
ncbi:MAG TPA: transcriptional repressor [Syntrophobacter fumaroxidans]|nr:transcriptional repressor [Syntrophobacter fumaroxidans]